MVKLTASFKSPADMIDPNVVYLPREFTWANLVTVFRGVEYPRTFLYTVLFVSLVSFLQTMSCTLVAYGRGAFPIFRAEPGVWAVDLYADYPAAGHPAALVSKVPLFQPI